MARLLENPPSAPEAEPLDELSEDLIIAQESRAHAPQPRVHVDIDPRSVVIARDAERLSDPGAATAPVRSLPPFTFAAEPTLVIKNRRSTHPRGSSHPPATRSQGPRRDQRVVIALMCLVAALLAFSLGGALALLLARRSGPPAQAAEPASAVQPPH